MTTYAIKFPVPWAEWEALCAIQASESKTDPLAGIIQAIDTGLARGFAANDFSDFTWAEEEVLPEFTAKEQELLDARLMATHEAGETSILDAFTAEGIGTLKPNFTEQIVSFYQANPGKSVSEGAQFLTEKFINHFDSSKAGYKKLYSLIHVLSSSRKQKRLTKVRNGSEVGVFVSHQ